MEHKVSNESKNLSQVTQFIPEIYQLLELLSTTSDITTVNKTVSYHHYNISIIDQHN